jgi:tetratricopeptide (TPR) repeat protein/transglutaminase-like putative cysteine protease
VFKLSSRHVSHLFLLSIAMAFACKSAEGQEHVEPWKAPHFSIDPKTLYEAASIVAAPENADVAILEDDESYSFDETGRSIHTEYVVYKVLNQKGAEGWDSVAVDWEPWHQARPSIKVRVIARDLSVHTLDQKQITEAPARGGEYKTYGDGKSLRAPFPAISPGVVVEEEFITAETSPFFAPGHVGRVYFGREGVPVAHSVAEFDAPSSLRLRADTVMLDGLQPNRSDANGRVTLNYEKGFLDGFDKEEPNLPPDVSHLPIVEFSTGASWQVMATEYSKIVDSHANLAAVQSIVDQLVSGKATVADKESAIIDYVDREIRYTGIEFDESAIVPHDLTDTLAHKYGDCKDKATLLAAMLRAAAIPAYVALLNAGSRLDVPADLPGMGLFDHAIVYVPGSPALWIDATDPWARLGQLPSADQGRWALIARPETTSLIRTSESTSKENTLLETRELTLAENGPANVQEITQPTGAFEGEYRAYYADNPDKDTRAGLSGYVKAQYISEKLTKVERTDPADLSKQFELTLECEKARRGYTDLDGAVAAIRVESLFQNLPGDLQRRDDSEDKRKDDKERPKPPRAVDWELAEPFTSEWHYRFIPPPGFVAKQLPQDAKFTLGPALLTESFSTDKDGSVLAQLTFDTVKRRYTVSEATELRNKIAEIASGPGIVVNFEPRAEVLLREGKVREALANYRSLVALHPNEAVHHLQVAKVLLEAGMGEAARTEARLAVKLEPDSALAEKTLAQVLKQDLVGRTMRAGSDLDGAAEAYRAAIKLDPDDHNTQGDLAILLEYDPVGRRYGQQSKMKEAVAEYQKLGQEKLTELGLANNLAFAMFYSGNFEGALKVAQQLNPEPRSLIAACVAMLVDSKTGLAEANKRSNDDNTYKETARVAGEMLMNIRKYRIAADFLEAGAAGDNAAQTMGLANLLRGAERHEDMKFLNTPQDLVKRFFLLSVDLDLTEGKLMSLASRNAIAAMKNEDPEELKKTLETGKKMNIQLARQDSSMDVTLDILMQAFDQKSEGSDATGYRVKVQIPGENTSTFYVVKEDGQYKLLDSSQKPNAVALEVLDRIKSGDLVGAKALLDWLREDQHLEGGDDPLGGPVFPRFWIKGEAADAGKMKLAAASLLVNSKSTVAGGVALLEEALKRAATDREKTNVELALAAGYETEENYQSLLVVSSELVKQVPESRLAFLNEVEAEIGLGRYDDAMALCDQRLKLFDGDSDAMLAKMRIDTGRGSYEAARGWVQKLVDSGKGDAGLLNSGAWFSLFTGKVSQEDISTAIKAAQMSKDNPAILHTLACLYAETGQTKEARDLLIRGLDELNLVEPDDDYWYAFGRIAEQYGERDIAVADYHRLAKPKQAIAIPTSTYLLAQTRLKTLGEGSTAKGK